MTWQIKSGVLNCNLYLNNKLLNTSGSIICSPKVLSASDISKLYSSGRGYRYDSETGLYYLQSRYYNPEWGRFHNADAIVAVTRELLSGNMFAYCKNNPINMYDDTGYRPVFVNEDDQDAYDEWASLQQELYRKQERDRLRGKDAKKREKRNVDSAMVMFKIYYTYDSWGKLLSINVKPSYYEASFNKQTGEIEIGWPITQLQSIERISNKQSIMCANATKALQVAKIKAFESRWGG